MDAKHWSGLVVAGVIALALSALSDRHPRSPEASMAQSGPAIGAQEPVPPLPAGDKRTPSIAGVVTWQGDVPQNGAIQMDSDPACKAMHEGQDLRKEDYVVNPNGTLRNVVVYVSEGLPKQAWPVRPETVTLDQKGCRFIPHVIAMQLGQKIEIRNSDKTTHNVHFKSKYNGDWNVTQTDQTPVAAKELPKRPEIGTVLFKCDIHTWMEARLAIFDHPFFAVTGDDGSFRIDGLPPGTYTLTAWHEKEKPRKVPVTVAEGPPAEAKFTFGKN